MHAENCIFCKIATGAIPCHRVFESGDALAFLDIGPLAPGHTLLIPKNHYASVLDAPPQAVAMLTSHIPTLANAILAATGAAGLNVLQNTGASAGQVVDHLHIHLIPRTDGDRLGFRWNAGKYGDGEAETVAARISESLHAK